MKARVKDDLTGQVLDLEFGQNIFTGLKSFDDYFSNNTSLESDLLNLGSCIYAADLAVKRRELEEFIRTIEVEIEVINYHAFQRVKDDIEEALFILSSDNWTIKFVQAAGEIEPVQEWETKDGVVLLFSGGLDSFSGAVHFLEKKRPLALVSHRNKNRIVKDSQVESLEVLKEEFKTNIDYFSYTVFTRNKLPHTFPTDSERENTQRTRSFLFLCLAALTARRIGYREIISMAENGQFAIHLPLNHARVGPFSTHTAHPEYLLKMESVFHKLLNFENLKIDNPFLYKTKAEVVSVVNPEILKKSNTTISCWMASRLKTSKHCGECIPCFSRRIALETNGILLSEYERDLWKEKISLLKEDDNGKRNLMDYLEFISKFSGYSDDRKEEILVEFPELYNDSYDQDEAISLYHRLANQSEIVFSNYPEIKKIMK